MIGIAGAGISGLSLGAELHRRGIPYRIFEGSSRVGGVIGTRRVDGFSLELGPQRIRPTEELIPLVEAIPGWDDRPLPTSEFDDRVWIARGGRLHPVPRSFREAVTGSILSFPGKFRMALEPLFAPSLADLELSAGEYLRRRAGNEAYRALLGPLFGGLYGTDPDEMDARRALFPALREVGGTHFLLGVLAASRTRGAMLSVPPVVPPGGMEALPRAMAEGQADAIELETPIDKVRRRDGGGWMLVTPRSEVEVDRVVLTTPPDVTARILAGVDPHAAQVVGGLRTNGLVLVHLRMERLPGGLGFQVAFGEKGRLRGMTFSGHLDGSGCTAVAFLGGMRDPGALELDDPSLAEIAAREAERWTGIRGEPLLVSRTRMPAWDRGWSALDDLHLPEGVELLTNYTGRPGIIGRVREARKLADHLEKESVIPG